PRRAARCALAVRDRFRLRPAARALAPLRQPRRRAPADRPREGAAPAGPCADPCRGSDEGPVFPRAVRAAGHAWPHARPLPTLARPPPPRPPTHRHYAPTPHTTTAHTPPPPPPPRSRPPAPRPSPPTPRPGPTTPRCPPRRRSRHRRSRFEPSSRVHRPRRQP